VTLAGYVAVGFGPVSTSPRLALLDVVRIVVLPMAAASSKLKLAFFTLKLAVPVEMEMVVPLSIAKLAPPKFPLAPSVSITAVVPPALNVGTTPQTLIHL
jgi:hypothetical protein